MRCPAFLRRMFRSADPSAERLRALDEQLEQSLQSRKADRATRQERARRGARTKSRQRFERDALRADRVSL